MDSSAFVTDTVTITYTNEDELVNMGTYSWYINWSSGGFPVIDFDASGGSDNPKFIRVDGSDVGTIVSPGQNQWTMMTGTYIASEDIFLCTIVNEGP